MALPPVAVIADAHLHDIADDPTGRGPMIGGRRAGLRNWSDTRAAARAFNESGRAFEAALARIAARGIRHVVLLGDCTDEGTRGGTRRLAATLAAWRDRHGMVFHALPGNHDMFAVAGKHTATRLATVDGRSVLVTSDPALAATEADAVTDPDRRCLGQDEAILALRDHGYFRRPGDLHWESPFGPDDRLDVRRHILRAPDGSVAHALTDASYLVEPVPGLWLLMLDANVFEPRPGIADPRRKRAFRDPSDAGWTTLLRLRPYLLDWIADVSRLAKARGKALLTFSHYPVVDPLGGTTPAALLFGEPSLARRRPAPQVAAALAAAGIRWHMGGHLHADGMHRHGALTDHAAPSLAAWPPAFKIVHPGPDGPRVETVSLAKMPLDPDLVHFYCDQGATGLPATFGPFLLDQARGRARASLLRRGWGDARLDRFAWMTIEDLRRLVRPETAPGADASDALPLALLFEDGWVLQQGGSLAGDAIPPTRRRLWADIAADVRAARHGLADDAALLADCLLRLSDLMQRDAP